MQKKTYITPLTKEILLNTMPVLLQASDSISTGGKEFDDEDDMTFAARRKRSAWDDDAPGDELE